MAFVIVYDDRARIPLEDQGVLGIARYGNIIHRKRTLAEQMIELLRGAEPDRCEILRDRQDAEALAGRLLTGTRRDRFLYVPSSVVAEPGERSTLFIAKLRFCDDDMVVEDLGRDLGPRVLLTGTGLLASLLEDGEAVDWDRLHRTGLPGLRRLTNHAAWRAIDERSTLVDFVSRTFDARAFNAISQEGPVIVKRSGDKAKMRREHAYYQQLVGPMRCFFLPPIDFRDEGETASYSIERLCVPDMAIQWVHGAFDGRAFGSFLERMREYLDLRQRRPDGSAGQARELYLGKVERRLEELMRHPRHDALRAMLEVGTGVTGFTELGDRYRRAWEAYGHDGRWRAISHGDLCFSNILYDRHTRLMKFIDPRGAESPDELHLDEYYDLAKLSHSILGGYDFINHDLVDLCLDRDLALILDSPLARGLEDHQEAFKEMIHSLGHSLRTVRLCEAGLFLSMLPLHVDVPKKVLAFTITGLSILDGLADLPD